MWEVFEHRNLGKKIPKILQEVLKRYEKWKDIVGLSGPDGLRLIKSFHDDALKDKWDGYRPSRLDLHYRII
jgi:proteic killer suppression protein